MANVVSWILGLASIAGFSPTPLIIIASAYATWGIWALGNALAWLAVTI